MATIQLLDEEGRKTQTTIKVASLASAEAIVPANLKAITNAAHSEPVLIVVQGLQSSGVSFFYVMPRESKVLWKQFTPPLD